MIIKYIKNDRFEERGFTLIELLVVIITVGVLSAIALPSFLNQVAKARGTEAKSGLGAINRSQQAYRFENRTFANQIGNLDVKITADNYIYSVSSSSQNSASHQTASQQSDLKQYSSWVEQNGDVFSQYICESNTVGLGISSLMTSSACPSNYNDID